MRRYVLRAAAIALLCFWWAGIALGASFEIECAAAMDELDVSAGHETLVVITDAEYVSHAGAPAVRFLDTIRAITGCSESSGNLLQLHRSVDNPLFAVLFRKDTGDCVVIRDHGGSLGQATVNLGYDRLGDAAWWESAQTILGASDAYGVIMLAHAWAEGMPYEFLRCAEFHNHICPGLTSGYLIVEFMRKHYPLGEGESYSYISCPSWCKDDAIQVMLDLTPGKHTLAVKQFSDAQLAAIPWEDAAGIMLIHRTGGIDALVLGYDWETAASLAEAEGLPELQNRVRMIVGMKPYLAEPERVVRVHRTVPLTDEQTERLARAGVNPYEVLAGAGE